METITQDPAPGRTPTPYDTRMVIYVTRDVRRRLDIQAAIEGRPVSHLITEHLSRSLCTSAELADLVHETDREARNGHADH